MLKFQTLEPAIDPNNRISFLLDWELTMKCNLDCSYCGSGLYKGHDNSQAHPALPDCVDTIDFMFDYVDLYMRHKPKGVRYVILNVYGGEALHHPEIISILESVHEKYRSNYGERWHLTVTTTTNAILSSKKLESIVPLIDEFTVSYHVENTAKQKQRFRENLLQIVQAGKRVKCVVLMHQEPDRFRDCEAMIAWCQQNHIKTLPRQLDGTNGTDNNLRIYPKEQTVWFDKFYQQKSYGDTSDSRLAEEDTNLGQVGRACCGGRQLCLDQTNRSRHFFVRNKFPDWFCSVNYFFLYVKQVNGEIFVNKDCKMNFDGTVGPIGNLQNAGAILATLEQQLETRSVPVIQCKKNQCWCGLCAPKARDKKVFDGLIEKYLS